jgi:hypothetical protein
MAWRPIPPRDYLIGLIGGLVLGVALAGAAIAAAILTSLATRRLVRPGALDALARRPSTAKFDRDDGPAQLGQEPAQFFLSGLHARVTRVSAG